MIESSKARNKIHLEGLFYFFHLSFNFLENRVKRDKKFYENKTSGINLLSREID